MCARASDIYSVVKFFDDLGGLIVSTVDVKWRIPGFWSFEVGSSLGVLSSAPEWFHCCSAHSIEKSLVPGNWCDSTLPKFYFIWRFHEWGTRQESPGDDVLFVFPSTSSALWIIGKFFHHDAMATLKRWSISHPTCPNTWTPILLLLVVSIADTIILWFKKFCLSSQANCVISYH